MEKENTNVLLFEEEWTDIVEYEGIYEISTLGNVRSLERYYIDTTGRRQHILNKILKPILSGNGYLSVGLNKDAKPTVYNIHSLMGICFLNKNYLKEGFWINHKDANKKNNRLDNLEVVTPAENYAHAVSLNLCSSIGDRNWNAKLTNSQVAEIREIFKTPYFGLGKELAEQYGVSVGTISEIKNKRHWLCVE